MAIAFTALCLALFFPTISQACSLQPTYGSSVSDYTAKSDFVFTGKVDYIYDREIDYKGVNRYAAFKIDKVFHSSDNQPLDTVKVYYYFIDYCGFGTHFQTGDSYIVFAKKHDDGYLYVTAHSGEYGGPLGLDYDKSQFSDFLHNGKDSYMPSGYCLMQIHLAYSVKKYMKKFILEDDACRDAIPYYDKYFLSKN